MDQQFVGDSETPGPRPFTKMCLLPSVGGNQTQNPKVKVAALANTSAVLLVDNLRHLHIKFNDKTVIPLVF